MSRTARAPRVTSSRSTPHAHTHEHTCSAGDHFSERHSLRRCLAGTSGTITMNGGHGSRASRLSTATSVLLVVAATHSCICTRTAHGHTGSRHRSTTITLPQHRGKTARDPRTRGRPQPMTLSSPHEPVKLLCMARPSQTLAPKRRKRC
jgi:hypothetical protein